MDKLPTSVIDNIVSILAEYEDISRLATVSEAWQHVVESRLFSDLTICTDRPYLLSFKDIILLPRHNALCIRRSYMQTIKFIVEVPFNESSAETGNSALFAFSRKVTEDLHALFCCLRACDVADSQDGISTGGSRGLTLELGRVETVLDGLAPRPRFYIGGLKVLKSQEGYTFPEVQCVSTLSVAAKPNGYRGFPLGRSLEPAAAIILAKFLPRMKRLEIISEAKFSFNDDIRIKRWLRQRESLVDELSKSHHRSELIGCTEMVMALEKLVPETFFGGNPVSNSSHYRELCGSFDALGPVMRTWSYNLVSLNLTGVFGISLFLQGKDESFPGSNHHGPQWWPRLKNFQVEFLTMTPSGAWYFNRNNESPHRNVVCYDTMVPLIDAWAKALRAMPMIESAMISWKLKYDKPNPNTKKFWVIAFEAPLTGLEHAESRWERDDEFKDSPMAIYKTDGWLPTMQVEENLAEMAEERFGLSISSFYLAC